MVAQGALGVPLAVAGLLVGLAVVEGYEQRAAVVREADVARIGHDGVHVAAVGRAVVVDEHVVEQVGVGVLVAYADGHVVQSVEEEPVAEFERLALLADVGDDAVHLLVGVGHQVVADEEAPHGNQTDEDEQRLGDAHEREPGGLHGQQFVVLAQVAHRHDGGQQHGQRQHVGHGVGHQFDDDAGAQPLAHQLVDVAPHEVHHQHEHDDEEREDHRPEVGFQNEFVDGFHAAVTVFLRRKVSSFTATSVRVSVNMMAAPGGTSRW